MLRFLLFLAWECCVGGASHEASSSICLKNRKVKVALKVKFKNSFVLVRNHIKTTLVFFSSSIVTFRNRAQTCNRINTVLTYTHSTATTQSLYIHRKIPTCRPWIVGLVVHRLLLLSTWLNVLEQGTLPQITPDGPANAWWRCVWMGEWEALYCKAALSHSGWKVQ